jgi:hypothetical protein
MTGAEVGASSGFWTRRVVATLVNIGRRHSVVITALKSGHSTYTVDGTVSNRAPGHAMDMGAVDSEPRQRCA